MKIHYKNIKRKHSVIRTDSAANWKQKKFIRLFGAKAEDKNNNLIKKSVLQEDFFPGKTEQPCSGRYAALLKWIFEGIGVYVCERVDASA